MTQNQLIKSCGTNPQTFRAWRDKALTEGEHFNRIDGPGPYPGYEFTDSGIALAREQFASPPESPETGDTTTAKPADGDWEVVRVTQILNPYLIEVISPAGEILLCRLPPQEKKKFRPKMKIPAKLMHFQNGHLHHKPPFPTMPGKYNMIAVERS